MAKRTDGLTKTARFVGGSLGTIVGRIEKLYKQRDKVAAEIHHLTNAASHALASMREGARHEAQVFQTAVAKGKPGRRGGFKMSKAARAKISAAQKKRWAKTRAEKKDK